MRMVKESINNPYQLSKLHDKIAHQNQKSDRANYQNSKNVVTTSSKNNKQSPRTLRAEYPSDMGKLMPVVGGGASLPHGLIPGADGSAGYHMRRMSFVPGRL